MSTGVGWDFGTTIASPAVAPQADQPKQDHHQSPTKQQPNNTQSQPELQVTDQPPSNPLIPEQDNQQTELMEVDPVEAFSSQPSQDGQFEWPPSMANQPDSPQKDQSTHSPDTTLGDLQLLDSDHAIDSSPPVPALAPATNLPRDKLILEEATPPASTHPSDDGNDLFALDDGLIASAAMADAPASSQLEEGEIREPAAPVAEPVAEAAVDAVAPQAEERAAEAGVVEISSSPSVEDVVVAAEDDISPEPDTQDDDPADEPEPDVIPAQPPTPSPGPQLATAEEPVVSPADSSTAPAEAQVQAEADVADDLHDETLLNFEIEQFLPPRDPADNLPSTINSASPSAPPSATAPNTTLTSAESLSQTSASAAQLGRTDANQASTSGGRPTLTFVGVVIPPRPAHIPSARSVRKAREAKQARAAAKGKAKAKVARAGTSEAEPPKKRGRPRKNPVEDIKPTGAAKKRARATADTDESEDERPAKRSAKASGKASTSASAKEANKVKAKEKARREKEKRKAEREKRMKRKEKRRQRDEDEADDESDDLELSGKETVQKTKLRPKKELTAQEKALRRMKEKRNAKNGEPSSSRRVVGGSSDSDRASNGQSPKLGKRKAGPRYAGASEASSSEETGTTGDDDDSSSDSNIENFIVDESDGDDEARELLEEQREKARTAKQGVFFHVKPFIQWLVYRCVDPTVDWLKNDESWRTAQREIEQFVKGLPRSLITDNVWKQEFRRALNSRPTLRMVDISIKKGKLAPRCEACNVGSHKVSSMVATLAGGRYDRLTFVKEEPDSDSDSDESDASDETDGGDRTFHLAGNCITKANSTNGILHWPYHTYKRVRYFVKRHKSEMTQVVNLETLPPDQAASIRRVEARMLQREATRLATLMDSTGKMSNMAREFRVLVDDLRGNFAS